MYCSVSIVVALVGRRIFRHRWIVYARVQLTLLGLSLALSFATENRHFWHFPVVIGFEILGVPIENLLFTFATINIILVQYAWLKKFID